MNSKSAIFALAVTGACLLTACTNDKKKVEEDVILELSREEIVINNDMAASVTFNVTCNTEWVADGNKTWIQTSPAGGSGNSTVTVTVNRNEDGDARTGAVEVMAGKTLEEVMSRKNIKKINVSQGKTIRLLLSETLVRLDDQATLTIIADEDWTIDAATLPDWLNVTPMNGSAGETTVLIFAASINGTDIRIGEITVKTATRSAACSVWQEENKFYFSSDSVYLSDKGHARLFRITSSAQWNVTGDNWIQVNIRSGAGSQLLKISAASENNSGVERKGKLVFSTGGASKEIDVVQGYTGNYWDDGNLLVVNRHSRGKGVPIVFVGDGFDRQDLKKGGWWEMWGRRMANFVMDVEVIKDMKEYLDVYVLMGESTERGIAPAGNTSNTKYRTTMRYENTNGIINDAISTVNEKGVTQQTVTRSNVRVGFIVNGYYPGSASNPLARMGLTDNYDYWAIHEFVGHVLCDMPDAYCGDSNANNDVDQALKTKLDAEHQNGFHWFVDYTNDPDKVIWKDFIGKPGYSDVGLFPASTNYNKWYCRNLWMPSAQTPMWQWMLCWDVGSRYHVWNKIHDRAGNPDGKYNNLAAFMEYDVNRTRCDCNLWKYNGKPRPYTWTIYNRNTLRVKMSGDYDCFWEALWIDYEHEWDGYNE